MLQSQSQTIGTMATGNTSQRSKTNLDEYINFFDSSAVLHAPSSDLQHENNDDRSISEVHHMGGYDDHTTTKKRQSKTNTALTGVTAEQQQYLGNNASAIQANTQHQISMMQSPLASYLNRVKQGTSASYHQQISVLSDFKDNDQPKTTQKNLQSPPEFASPLDTYGQHMMMQMHQHHQQLAPILENGIALNSSNSHLAMLHQNLNHQQKGSLSGNNNGFPSHYQNFHSSGHQNISQESYQQADQKLSFAKFYEKTVSPLHNNRHQYTNSQSQGIATHEKGGRLYKHQVRPFNTTTGKNNQGGDAAERSVLACEQIMEQIAAIIDYDISDYLPPNSASRNVQSSFKTSHQQNVQKRRNTMTNNFMQTTGTQNIHVNKLSRFSVQDKENLRVDKSLLHSQKYTKHNSTHHVTHHSNLTVDHPSNRNSLTESSNSEEGQKRSASESEGCTNQQRSRTQSRSCSHSKKGKQRKGHHRGHQQQIHRHNRHKTSSNDLRVTHQSATEPSPSNDDGQGQSSCHKRHGSKQFHHKCKLNSSGMASRKQESCCQKPQNRCCSSQHGRENHHQHGCNNGKSQSALHLDSNGFWSKSHREQSQEQLSFNSSIEASDRQKLAMMILQGDQSVQIIKQDTSSVTFPKASPRFQLQVSQSAENSDKAQMSLLQSLINPSDFQQLLRQQPGSSRNIVQNKTQQQSGHIYVSAGTSGGSPTRINNSALHTRQASLDSVKTSQVIYNHQQPPQMQHSANNMTQNSDMIHLTTINAAPLGLTQQSVADISQSNTIHDIKDALEQHNLNQSAGVQQQAADPQTSFSQLYQPYNHQQQILNQSKKDESVTQEAPQPQLQQQLLQSARDPTTSTAAFLNVEFQQTSFAVPGTKGEKQLDSSRRYSMFSQSNKQSENLQRPTRRAMSLTDSVICIQRTYRAILTRRHQQNDANNDSKSSPSKNKNDAGHSFEQEIKQPFQNPDQKQDEMTEKKNIVIETKSLKSTQEAESSDIELPEMFEYDSWWLEAERPMTDECLTAFLKKHL